MAKVYYRGDVEIVTKTVEIFECPDCGFEFNAHHENDDQVGGWECPLCIEVEQQEEIEEQERILKQQDKIINGLSDTNLMFFSKIVNYEKALLAYGDKKGKIILKTLNS
jgi:ssDNA-binding Zn-finger/Zn-ribbon topoisomerase 1